MYSSTKMKSRSLHSQF